MSTKIPIFWKRCPKSLHSILQNTKYIREYNFYKMCTSGRINFFWGVFSAFMVYALALISTASLVFAQILCVPNICANTSEVIWLSNQKFIYIYRCYTKIWCTLYNDKLIKILRIVADYNRTYDHVTYLNKWMILSSEYKIIFDYLYIS